MQHIATWSRMVCELVCLSVCLYWLWALHKWLNQSRCHLRCGLRWVRGTVLDGVQVPQGKGHFWGGWRWDFSHMPQISIPSGLNIGISHMLSTSLPISQLRKQWGVILNIPSAKIPLQCSLSSKFFDFLSGGITSGWVRVGLWNYVWGMCHKREPLHTVVAGFCQLYAFPVALLTLSQHGREHF